ncbi:class I SAM-dependent methyltransferase [Kineosporia mesophila]|uniref:Class I SAM-dependent methyltransferase n=1 Tax=Kineosporia mesophila TaxID=566012 RepID=A0ABP6Z920_9ACTN|nr:class I SAM-dependent methyltransferase [Kineosporia mesophila]MCD5352927.1 class I SAM-dependent methyltransferase [Kineosporia mesophila]
MLTLDYDRLDVRAGTTLLDLGCGEGRHTFEAYRRGADVISLDLSAKDLATTRTWTGAMDLAGETPTGARTAPVVGDLRSLPLPDESFDRVIASEVLEHVQDDAIAIAEIARVLKPGGLAAITVPRWLPERICWALSDEYHANEGGHVRIYKASDLAALCHDAGLEHTGTGHAHALHSVYWWLKCFFGMEDTPIVRAYHRLLVWDIMKKPRTTKLLERALNPLIGKSVVLYLRKSA